jgi:hypothetical protein
MTRTWRIVAGITVAAWLVGGACLAAPSAAEMSPDEKYIGELLDILEHTRSPDTFQLTLTLLIEAKADARRTVPLALRNAERLGILSRHLLLPSETPGPKGYQASVVAELILELAGTKGGSSSQRRAEKHSRPAATMGLTTPVPVPVPPWVTERVEEKYRGPSDFRTPILPPLRAGVPPRCADEPPGDAEVLRALRRTTRIPFLYAESRDDVQIVTEKLVDKVDPPRFFPLIGPAQLHHCHWKATVSYTETAESAYPFPFRIRRPRVESVFLDTDHLHRVAEDKGAAPKE